MIAFAADENFNHDIVRALLRRAAGLDLVRIQDEGLSGASDPEVLDWAAKTNRVLLTHDVSTITKFAFERIDIGKAMPGVFEVPHKVAIGTFVEDLMLIVECSQQGEWDGQVRYLPLR